MARPLLQLALLLALVQTTPAVGWEPPKQDWKEGDVVLETAALDAGGGKQVAFELGTLYVQENRADPKSRIIRIGFARFPGEKGADAPPIFMLPGGPASSYLTSLKPGRPVSSDVLRQMQVLRRVGDVVLVDQRGFSERGEILRHLYTTPAEPLDRPADLERSTAAFQDVARAAVEAFAKKGIDLRGYTVKECADDVETLRRALRYERITLMGGSFGSQWSFAVMRRHGDRVARALLTGVEPLDCGYDMPSHVMAAVQRMWYEAEQDEKLRPYLPPGGLMAALRTVLRRLEQQPLRVALKNVTDSKTGEPVSVTLGPEDLRRAGALRSPQGPAFVLSLYHGHYQEWAAAVNQVRRARLAALPVIAPLIDTSLGVTPRRRYLLTNDPATEFLGQWNFHSYLATADIWPSPDVDDALRTEVPCDIPVVFVQGDWDVQTPVENLLQVAPYFRNGHLLIVERGGHGAVNQLHQHLPDTATALIGFLKSGDTSGLPHRVTLPRPTFPVPGFPPP